MVHPVLSSSRKNHAHHDACGHETLREFLRVLSPRSSALGSGPPSSSTAALRFAVGCPGRKMPSGVGPDLKKYMDKRLAIKLNGNRTINGTLRGFDQFMNLVLDETVEQVTATEQNSIGMVVIRGNSIVMIEALEKLWD